MTNNTQQLFPFRLSFSGVWSAGVSGEVAFDDRQNGVVPAGNIAVQLHHLLFFLEALLVHRLIVHDSVFRTASPSVPSG